MKFLLILLSCFTACNDALQTSKGINAITKLANKKYKLDCTGSGFQGPNIIKNFRLAFESNLLLSKEQARKLLIDLTEDYICLINNMPDVLRNIDNLPLNEDHAFIIISFNNLNNINSDYVAVCLSNKKVEFLEHDQMGYYKTTESEPYSEAHFKVYGRYPPLRWP